jgi:muconolactone delta-isomerase
MKFLVLRKPRVSSGMIPASKAIREQKQGALDAVKRGTIDCIYAFPGGGGNVGIVNADSPEQLNEVLMSTPLFLYSEFEVRPLTDYDKYMENVAAALEKRER